MSYRDSVTSLVPPIARNRNSGAATGHDLDQYCGLALNRSVASIRSRSLTVADSQDSAKVATANLRTRFGANFRNREREFVPSENRSRRRVRATGCDSGIRCGLAPIRRMIPNRSRSSAVAGFGGLPCMATPADRKRLGMNWRVSANPKAQVRSLPIGSAGVRRTVSRGSLRFSENPQNFSKSLPLSRRRCSISALLPPQIEYPLLEPNLPPQIAGARRTVEPLTLGTPLCGMRRILVRNGLDPPKHRTLHRNTVRQSDGGDVVPIGR